MRISSSVLEFIHVLTVSLSVSVFSIAVRAQSPEPADNAPQSVPVKPEAQILSDEKKEDFRTKMMGIPLRRSGCFEAKYPNEEWKEVACGPVPKSPNPLTLGPASPSPNAGNGNDYFAQVTGNISSATGSFDSATGISAVYSPTYTVPSTPTVVHPNTYSLQLNSDIISTSANCAGGGCSGWEQFIFSQRQCDISGLQSCVFIEYWLYNSPACPRAGGTGCSCPSAVFTPYFDPTGNTASGCFVNTPSTMFSTPAIADLGSLKLTGTANSGGMDQVTVQTADGLLHTKAFPDSTIGLANGWHGVEFNLFGDCCAYEAFLNSGSQLTLRLNATSSSAPICLAPNTFSGETAETNNLQLNLGSCHPSGAAIVFSEGGGGSLPSGYTIGDTHLTTFFGVHYDFQASGDFVLVQADPGLLVQTRQKPLPANPIVSVNTAVGVKTQDNRVAICLAGLSINGSFKALTDGESWSLPNDVKVARSGLVYTVSSPSGDIVRADLGPGSYMNVSVDLGVTNPTNIRGLLGGEGGEKHDLIDGYGKPFRSSLSYSEFGGFGDTWRVRPRDSLMLCDQYVEPGWPKGPIYAENLPPRERERARQVCMRAGVKNEVLLDDCTLDVSLLGTDAAAAAYVSAPVHAPDPARELRPY